MLACHAGRHRRARAARKGASSSSSLSPACMLSEEVRLGPRELFLHLLSFWEGSTFPVSVPAKRRVLWLHIASRGRCLSNSAFVTVQPSLNCSDFPQPAVKNCIETSGIQFLWGWTLKMQGPTRVHFADRFGRQLGSFIFISPPVEVKVLKERGLEPGEDIYERANSWDTRTDNWPDKRKDRTLGHKIKPVSEDVSPLRHPTSIPPSGPAVLSSRTHPNLMDSYTF